MHQGLGSMGDRKQQRAPTGTLAPPPLQQSLSYAPAADIPKAPQAPPSPSSQPWVRYPLTTGSCTPVHLARLSFQKCHPEYVTPLLKNLQQPSLSTNQIQTSHLGIQGPPQVDPTYHSPFPSLHSPSSSARLTDQSSSFLKIP